MEAISRKRQVHSTNWSIISELFKWIIWIHNNYISPTNLVANCQCKEPRREAGTLESNQNKQQRQTIAESKNLFSMWKIGMRNIRFFFQESGASESFKNLFFED